MATVARISSAHFRRLEHGVEDHEDEQQRDGHDQRQALVGPLLALIFSRPVEVVAGGQFHLAVDLGDGLFDGAAKIAAANAVFDRHIALVGLAVDLLRAIFHLSLGQLREGDSFARGREQANVVDRLRRVAIGLLVADHQVVARLSLQHLADGSAADRGLDRVLNVADVDAIAGRRLAVDDVVQVWLADRAKEPEVLNALDSCS